MEPRLQVNRARTTRDDLVGALPQVSLRVSHEGMACAGTAGVALSGRAWPGFGRARGASLVGSGHLGSREFL